MNTIYTIASPIGKISDEAYTYDKSLETDLVLKVSKMKFEYVGVVEFSEISCWTVNVM